MELKWDRSFELDKAESWKPDWAESLEVKLEEGFKLN
jgi:hypothetical protein